MIDSYVLSAQRVQKIDLADEFIPSALLCYKFIESTFYFI